MTSPNAKAAASAKTPKTKTQGYKCIIHRKKPFLYFQTFSMSHKATQLLNIENITAKAAITWLCYPKSIHLWLQAVFKC